MAQRPARDIPVPGAPDRASTNWPQPAGDDFGQVCVVSCWRTWRRRTAIPGPEASIDVASLRSEDRTMRDLTSVLQQLHHPGICCRVESSVESGFRIGLDDRATGELTSFTVAADAIPAAG